MATVAIVMGSKSDMVSLKGAFETLHAFGVDFEVRVISAHRTPDAAADFAKNAEKNGTKAIICAAGMAAHLAGVIAAHTIVPVIGIPMACEPFNGFDALLSTVQMPGGIPVATVAINGSENAALLAAQMIALSDDELAQKLLDMREDMHQSVLKKDAALNV